MGEGAQQLQWQNDVKQTQSHFTNTQVHKSAYIKCAHTTKTMDEMNVGMLTTD